MKKILISATVLLFALGAKAQQTEYFYQVNGLFKDNRTAGLNGKWVHFKPLTGNGLFLTPTGSIGIGTTSPDEKLEVIGNLQSTMGIFTNSLPTQNFSSYDERNYKCTVLSAGTLLNSAQRARTFQFFDFPQSNLNPTPTIVLDIEDRGYKSRMSFRASMNSESVFTLYDKTQAKFFKVSEDGSGNAYMVLNNPSTSCYMAIGTESFTDGSDIYRLSINGKMRAHEVKVYTTWADYVFEDDYKLKSLDEVEQFINENGHLPNVPSAKEVEEKGLEVGNMMKIQQEKIEELTLYLIEQKKENDQLKKDVEELKAAVKALTNKQ